MLRGSEIDQTDNTAMRQPSEDCEFSEVLVQRDEYSPLTVGLGKNRLITGILAPIADPDDVVTRRRKSVTRLSGDARIQEQVQELAPMKRGSMRSFAVILRA